MATTYDLPATQVVGAKFVVSLFNRIRDCVDFLRNPPRAFYSRGLGDADYSITSTTFVDLDATNLSKTITTQGGLVRILFTGYVTGATVLLDFIVDGASITGNTTGLGNFSLTEAFHAEKIVSLTAGSHTFKVQARVAAGTAVIQSEQLTQFLVEEI